METIESARVLSEKVGSIRRVPGRKAWLPPWLFKHQDLIHALESGHKVSQESLVNILNHIHFMDKCVLALLRQPRYEESILMRAHPEPCLGRTLVCRWADQDFSGLSVENFVFLHLIVDDGLSMILVPAVLQEMDREGLTLELPEESYAVGERRSRRYTGQGVTAELFQSGFLAKGELMDFNPLGFRIRVRAEPSCSFRWFNTGELVTIHLRYGQQILFSGPCRYIRHRGEPTDREMVLCPVTEAIRRFKKKQIRNVRQRLVPSPTLSFTHPFLGKKVQLHVDNISTSGFSVYEENDERLLVPGMIIPEMTISFAGALRLNCAAQVIYHLGEEGKGIRYGVAILDMDIHAYSRLTHILTNALDPHAYISTEVDMDALWEFFFTTGFIYPKKYRLIQSHREDFRKTYEKLYQENPEIARHFTYQRNGRIYGHISMVRAYEQAWMIHHHAAQAMDSKRTGFMVLKQIMHYLNDMYRLPSANIDYVMCYFRPENKFPDRVFGGFARELNNPQGCSTDLFSYLPYTGLSLGTPFPEGWQLEECSVLHLWELKQFYSHCSGGLLMDALGLSGSSQPSDEPLKQAYKRLGFLREWKLYSLTHEGELNAVLIANRSDLGFNLSELLNGIKILVTNPGGLPWNVLSIAISRLADQYHMEKIPVLFFPFNYVKEKGVPYEKQYQLWVLNVQYGNEYLEYMQKRFRISYT